MKKDPKIYIKNGWKKIKDNLKCIEEILSFEETKRKLLHNDFYKDLFGRSKNRTLIKKDPILYNSIYHHTRNLEFYFKKQKSYKGWYNFTYRIKFIIEHDSNINELKCKCGNKYTWTTYCRYCPDYHRTYLGKVHTTDTKKKMRLSAIETIKNSKGQCFPRYNKNSIKIIEDFGEKNNFKFQHAENGGEFFIKELGYWVDAYDKEKNVVLEIDEPRHFTNGKLKHKDILRQSEIENYLGCRFFRIKYNGI
tara:strand:- start:17 stop:766 length:750 start_codon:yes stop_codon:yes gene_type:complete